jgi:hypothetical protein
MAQKGLASIGEPFRLLTADIQSVKVGEPGALGRSDGDALNSSGVANIRFGTRCASPSVSDCDTLNSSALN